FFFQAEDGIRDKLVTGVQTCALPIYPSWPAFRINSWNFWGVVRFDSMPFGLVSFKELTVDSSIQVGVRGPSVWVKVEGKGSFLRSEERRVGKECRYRWWGDEYRKDNM